MFSVVIPLYNKASYIGRALDSVFAQALPPVEIIVVNDGSTDGGEQVAKGLHDPRLRVIDQGNRGVSAARNAGIAAATQPYIAFLDADDRWLPDFLAHVREMIARCPGAVLYGTGFMTVAHGRVTGRYGVRLREIGHHARKQAPAAEGPHARPVFGPVDLFRLWLRGHVIHTSSMVVPRAAASAVAGFPEGVAICEDFMFLAKLAFAGPVVLSSEALTHYDVGIPGQAAEYWQKGYKQGFEVLAYHRFLAEQLRERGGSFARYCRKEFRKALLQRLYWGRFEAMGRYWRELELEGRALGWGVGACGWVVRHPAAQPALRAVMAAARAVRVSAATQWPQRGE